MPEIKSFDRVADIYDETRGLPPEAEREIAAGIARELREIAPEPRLLEVGIGTGRIAVPLAAAGVRVAGIDISPKMLGHLRAKRTDIDVLLAEAARPPLRDASFDAALFVHILHLVPDAEATLRATIPLLRPGGALIFGGDDGRVGLRREADRLIRNAVADIAGIDLESGGVKRATELAERIMREQCGDVRTITLARWTQRSRGRIMLERLGRRDFSSSWKIPIEALPAIIERVTPQLEELYGGLDREMESERSFDIMIGRLSG
ncbi:MAG: class I SAM-dependent methyltransferase [Chloroflexota bacterium]|nr:class I SAM-dependent methyltransferase [Chloroflexota bacterium]